MTIKKENAIPTLTPIAKCVTSDTLTKKRLMKSMITFNTIIALRIVIIR
ncbi:hypothetical protein JFL43_00575 [Viridibacillus sp. YIM B01967]|uniref:Uncharacterized protein n=1 Tax=Viridibacillus soli TaxID=2798301 RepID=A0ABS1H248_9BACL|nr:hypothetical protein [Viridibacillus soli]MBK3493386.1 hypothetical protein [Viridibacillus soli]